MHTKADRVLKALVWAAKAYEDGKDEEMRRLIVVATELADGDAIAFAEGVTRACDYASSGADAVPADLGAVAQWAISEALEGGATWAAR